MEDILLQMLVNIPAEREELEESDSLRSWQNYTTHQTYKIILIST